MTGDLSKTIRVKLSKEPYANCISRYCGGMDGVASSVAACRTLKFTI
jgi:hypothetical protein